MVSITLQLDVLVCVCAVTFNVFSWEDATNGVFPSCFDFKIIIMVLRSKDPMLSQEVYNFQINPSLLTVSCSVPCHGYNELVSTCSCLFCLLMVAFFWVQSLEVWSGVILSTSNYSSVFSLYQSTISLAKKFLMMPNKFNARKSNSGSTEEWFWMHLKAWRKSPKPFYFLLDTEQAAGCLSQQLP